MWWYDFCYKKMQNYFHKSKRAFVCICILIYIYLYKSTGNFLWRNYYHEDKSCMKMFFRGEHSRNKHIFFASRCYTDGTRSTFEQHIILGSDTNLSTVFAIRLQKSRTRCTNDDILCGGWQNSWRDRSLLLVRANYLYHLKYH